jgi:hypothetical protein
MPRLLQPSLCGTCACTRASPALLALQGTHTRCGVSLLVHMTYCHSLGWHSAVLAEIESCSPNPCQGLANSNNTCFDLDPPLDGYTCACDTGYTWNGTACAGTQWFVVWVPAMQQPMLLVILAAVLLADPCLTRSSLFWLCSAPAFLHSQTPTAALRQTRTTVHHSTAQSQAEAARTWLLLTWASVVPV